MEEWLGDCNGDGEEMWKCRARKLRLYADGPPPMTLSCQGRVAVAAALDWVWGMLAWEISRLDGGAKRVPL